MLNKIPNDIAKYSIALLALQNIGIGERSKLLFLCCLRNLLTKFDAICTNNKEEKVGTEK